MLVLALPILPLESFWTKGGSRIQVLRVSHNRGKKTPALNFVIPQGSSKKVLIELRTSIGSSSTRA